MVPIGTQFFLLANGLSILGAPNPRERFLGFAVLGGCIGLLVGAPTAMFLAVAAVAADAKHTHEEHKAGRWPIPADGWRALPPPPPDDYDYGAVSYGRRVW